MSDASVLRPRRRAAMWAVPALLAVGVTGAAPSASQAQQEEPGGGEAGQVAEGFDDLGEAGAHETDARRLAAEGIFDSTGCAEGLFCPGEPLERWTMAVWLVRILDSREPPAIAESRFSDVDPDTWWAPYVERLAELEVTAGCGTDPPRFCPHTQVSRAQMATFLARAFDLEPADAAGFQDVAGAHAADINALAASGVTAGCSTDPLLYCPSAATTRAQMATFLVRAIDRQPAGQDQTAPDAGDQAAADFSDLGEAGVHETDARRLAAEGIFDSTGCAEGLFCPGEPLERWTMAVWLVRILDSSEPPAIAESRFSDVDPDTWWAPHVERLAELEVTAGCGTDPPRFCPHTQVSRAQMATFLARAFDLEPADAAGFQDVAGAHAADINALAASGITAGCSTDPLLYCPSTATSRAQMATFLARAIDRQPAGGGEEDAGGAGTGQEDAGGVGGGGGGVVGRRSTVFPQARPLVPAPTGVSATPTSEGFQAAWDDPRRRHAPPGAVPPAGLAGMDPAGRRGLRHAGCRCRRTQPRRRLRGAGPGGEPRRNYQLMDADLSSAGAGRGGSRRGQHDLGDRRRDGRHRRELDLTGEPRVGRAGLQGGMDRPESHRRTLRSPSPTRPPKHPGQLHDRHRRAGEGLAVLGAGGSRQPGGRRRTLRSRAGRRHLASGTRVDAEHRERRPTALAAMVSSPGFWRQGCHRIQDPLPARRHDPVERMGPRRHRHVECRDRAHQRPAVRASGARGQLLGPRTVAASVRGSVAGGSAAPRNPSRARRPRHHRLVAAADQAGPHRLPGPLADRARPAPQPGSAAAAASQPPRLRCFCPTSSPGCSTECA